MVSPSEGMRPRDMKHIPQHWEGQHGREGRHEGEGQQGREGRQETRERKRIGTQ